MKSHVALHTHFSLKTPKEILSTSFSSHVLAKLQLFVFLFCLVVCFFLQIWRCAAIEQLIVQCHRLTLQQHREELRAVALKMLHLCVTKTFTILHESNILIVQFHNKNKGGPNNLPLRHFPMLFLFFFPILLCFHGSVRLFWVCTYGVIHETREWWCVLEWETLTRMRHNSLECFVCTRRHGENQSQVGFNTSSAAN